MLVSAKFDICLLCYGPFLTRCLEHFRSKGVTTVKGTQKIITGIFSIDFRFLIILFAIGGGQAFFQARFDP